MNKEVEEIKNNLDFARDVFDYTLNPNQCGLLIDYINQLEEKVSVLTLLENEFDKEEYEFLKKEILEIKGGSNE